MSPDVFGDIIDADTVEQAALTTLQAWLPAHLAHQERRRSLTPGTLPAPRSWPAVSEFDHSTMKVQLPAIVVVSPGLARTPERAAGGNYRAVWRLEVAAVIGGRTEKDARRIAALYLAAIRGAMVQNPRLDGTAEHTQWAGPDDHSFGTAAAGGSPRAIYGTVFEVTVRDVVNSRQGPGTPPEDPYNPGGLPPLPDTAEFIVETDMESP